MPTHDVEYHKTTPDTEEIWRPSDTEVIKINVDTAFQSSVRLATTADLARDSTGEIVGAETYLFADVVDAFVAEARACERALIFGDSLTVIKNIKKKKKDKSVLRPITHHISILESQFDNVTYRFVPRMANGAAHTLALERRRSQHSGVWVDGVPDSVKTMAMKDCLDWTQIYHVPL
ncbi:hypothetical protein PVK06_007773 [Gossypium arboreum]|uniref:RNase H type-1 domain-containing protein n=1 Tax=Gossypium arboreum TaxID=29729 RepID=A0ABR0QJM1_GOSAR|nr:hypothetical protein PVK06_007773 [Gossypium arboreum]